LCDGVVGEQRVCATKRLVCIPGTAGRNSEEVGTARVGAVATAEAGGNAAGAARLPADLSGRLVLQTGCATSNVDLRSPLDGGHARHRGRYTALPIRRQASHRPRGLVSSGEEEWNVVAVFDPEKHIKSVLGVADISLLHSNGTVLPGILGRPGAGEDACVGMRIGVDRIVLQPGSEFEIHTHPPGRPHPLRSRLSRDHPCRWYGLRDACR
jgi:hypothetical protein